MSEPIVVVTGATGLLGPYLTAAGKNQNRVFGLARRGTDIDCDLCDPDQTLAAVGKLRPDLVIHAAAYTDVDGCEDDPIQADRVNHLATASLAKAMNGHGHLVCVSTDQVYGDTAGPNVEGDEAPVNAYGRSKLAGELAALNGHPKTTVVRTNIFGPSRTNGRKSLSDFVVESLTTGRRITLFTDVLFSPLHMATLAKTVFEMAAKNISGVFNVGSRGGMSKRDFGHLVAQHFNLGTESATDGVSSAVLGRAARPRDLRMDVRKVEAALGRPMPTCEEQIALL
ncbi:MAG: SDR family oxidoreductase [Alphaproteobacteria bacterium]|jgi:dTDP-4-dehydrorhamnose reductase|nr:SDR family oxidoreductase [Alphaproteobacteria bacterium]